MDHQEVQIVPTPGLSSEQWREFEETGLMRLPQAISKQHVDEMRAALWAEIEKKHHFQENLPETWKDGNAFGLQYPGRTGAFVKMASPMVCAALEDLFAPDGWTRPEHWGSPLVTFPARKPCPWGVPNQTWHLDIYGDLGVRRNFGELTVFAFLDSVVSEGGATVAVIGTHRLIREYAARTQTKVRSENGREFLKQADPWFRDLWSKEFSELRMKHLMQEGAVVLGVPVRVVEITGEPGEVVIMHSSILHAPSPNCGAKPRLVLRQSVYRIGTLQPPDD